MDQTSPSDLLSFHVSHLPLQHLPSLQGTIVHAHSDAHRDVETLGRHGTVEANHEGKQDELGNKQTIFHLN